MTKKILFTVLFLGTVALPAFADVNPAYLNCLNLCEREAQDSCIVSFPKNNQADLLNACTEKYNIDCVHDICGGIDENGTPLPVGKASQVPCPPNQLCNPIGQDNFQDLVNAIVGTLPKIIIPLAVIIIIWIGIKFFLAQGNTEKIKKARDALLWTVVGLAIILIGTGFVSLIKSILDLRSTP